MDEISEEEAKQLMKENFPEKYKEVYGEDSQEEQATNIDSAAKEADEAKEVASEEEEQDPAKEKEKDDKPRFVNPFNKANQELEQPQEEGVDVLKSKITELETENEVLNELLNDDYVKLALEAKESGKSFFDAVDELRPKSVDQFSVEDIFEEMIKKYSKIDKWTEDEIEAEREEFEKMSKSQKRNHVSAFAKELETEFAGKKTDYKFDAKKQVESQKEFKKLQSKIIEEIADNVTKGVEYLVEKKYIDPSEKQAFFKEIESVGDLYTVDANGMVRPNTDLLLEIAYLRRSLATLEGKTAEKTKKEVLAQEKAKRTNVLDETSSSGAKQISNRDAINAEVEKHIAFELSL